MASDSSQEHEHEQEQLKNAVSFLQHPKVSSAPLENKTAFLHSKGLSNETIAKALRQIDPNSADAVRVEKGELNVAIPTGVPPCPAPAPAPAATAAAPLVPVKGADGVTYVPVAGPAGTVVYQAVGRPPKGYGFFAPAAAGAALMALGTSAIYAWKYVLGAEPEPKPETASAPESELEQANAELHDAVELLKEQSVDMKSCIASIAESLESIAAQRSSDSARPVSFKKAELSPALHALLDGHGSSVPPAPKPASINVDTVPSPQCSEAEIRAAVDTLAADADAFQDAAPVIRMYFHNILENPLDSRYHQINMTSRYYKEKICGSPAAEALFSLVGFAHNDNFWKWEVPRSTPPAQAEARARMLSIVIEFLDEAMRVKPSANDELLAAAAEVNPEEQEGKATTIEQGKYPKSFMEVVQMVKNGQTPDDVQNIDDSPPDPTQPFQAGTIPPKSKPWERVQELLEETGEPATVEGAPDPDPQSSMRDHTNMLPESVERSV